jgi:hypothetical protein
MGEGQLEVVSTETSLPNSECVIRKVDEDGGSSMRQVASIEVRCRLPLGTKPKEYILKVTSNDSNVPSRQVQLAAFPYMPVRVEPNIIHLLPDVRDAVVIGRIMATGVAVRLLGATTDSDLIQASMETSNQRGNDGEIGRLVIRPKRLAKSQRGLAIVTLRYRPTEMAEPLDLSVPVTIGTAQ